MPTITPPRDPLFEVSLCREAERQVRRPQLPKSRSTASMPSCVMCVSCSKYASSWLVFRDSFTHFVDVGPQELMLPKEIFLYARSAGAARTGRLDRQAMLPDGPDLAVCFLACSQQALLCYLSSFLYVLLLLCCCGGRRIGMGRLRLLLGLWGLRGWSGCGWLSSGSGRSSCVGLSLLGGL